MRIKPKARNRALSLTELLCVLAILGILLPIYLPTLARSFKRVRAFLGGF